MEINTAFLKRSNMPKMKTKKSAAKRFRVKPSGKIKYDRVNHEHLATKKSKGRKNKLKKAKFAVTADKGLILRCLPYDN